MSGISRLRASAVVTVVPPSDDITDRCATGALPGPRSSASAFSPHALSALRAAACMCCMRALPLPPERATAPAPLLHRPLMEASGDSAEARVPAGHPGTLLIISPGTLNGASGPPSELPPAGDGPSAASAASDAARRGPASASAAALCSMGSVGRAACGARFWLPALRSAPSPASPPPLVLLAACRREERRAAAACRAGRAALASASGASRARM